MRPKDRISPAVHFIDQNGDCAVAVGIFEREIDPDLGLLREFLEVESRAVIRTCRSAPSMM